MSTELFKLANKVALVTGATSGMGKAIAQALGAHGAKMAIASNDEIACIETEKEFAQTGITAKTFVFDAADKNSIHDLAQNVKEHFGNIDILVSCVGIGPAVSFMDIDSNLYNTVMGINLQSAIYLTKQVVPNMQAQKEGVIIYIASIASVRGNKNIGLYGISKAGLVQLAKNLAVEYGPDNIRVNAISPGLIDTPFAASLTENEAFMKKRLSLTPLRRVGTADEVAGVAVMLASKAGGFITGQNIIVDGGTTISDGN